VTKKKQTPQKGKAARANVLVEPQKAEGWALPALRGVQAGREYYVVMTLVRDVYRLLPPVDPRVAPNERAQRVLSMPRVLKLAAYLTGNPKDYTLAPLVGLIDGMPTFERSTGALGTLRIPAGMKLATLDGQHRRAALEMASMDRPGLRDEWIPVVLFVDVGLERAQQRFSDLNGHAARPPKSLSLLFDHRSELSSLARAVVQRVPLLATLVDGERANVAGRSGKLFGFAAIHAATKALLAGRSLSREDATTAAVAYWKEVAQMLPCWAEAAGKAERAAELRSTCIAAHGVALEALGRVGNAVVGLPDLERRAVLAKLTRIDWSRDAPIWAERAVLHGRMVKNARAVLLTANAIKLALGLTLSPEDREHEAVVAS